VSAPARAPARARRKAALAPQDRDDGKAPAKQPRAKRGTTEAEKLVQIKVGLPVSLLARIDIHGLGNRSQVVRDTLADRLQPSAAVLSAQRLTQLIANLEAVGDELLRRAVFNTKLVSLHTRRPILSEELLAALLDVARASDELRAAVVDDMLARAGLRRTDT
jgi:hypothetical protein